MNGITFNGKHSYNDFGLILEYFKPQLPAPKKIIEPVPYMSGDGYDFSTIGSGGEIVYTDRDITCKLSFMEKSKELLEIKYMAIAEWLLGAGKAQLISDAIPNYYFMAEVQQVPAYDEVRRSGSLELVFRADTYRYGASLEGSDQLWDAIDFNLPDYIQDTKFQVVEQLSINLYNPASHSIVPTIIVDQYNILIRLDSKTWSFNPTNNTNYDFKLKPGNNNLFISGNCNIEFQFRKEVL